MQSVSSTSSVLLSSYYKFILSFRFDFYCMNFKVLYLMFIFGRFIIIAQVLIVSCKDNNWITIVGISIYCDCCNIFFLFLWGEVLCMFREFIFMKFISEKWTQKYYLFMNLERKVMNLISKIKKPNHFRLL